MGLSRSWAMPAAIPRAWCRPGFRNTSCTAAAVNSNAATRLSPSSTLATGTNLRSGRLRPLAGAGRQAAADAKCQLPSAVTSSISRNFQAVCPDTTNASPAPLSGRGPASCGPWPGSQTTIADDGRKNCPSWLGHKNRPRGSFFKQKVTDLRHDTTLSPGAPLPGRTGTVHGD